MTKPFLKPQIRMLFLFLFTLMSAVSCISVNLKSGAPKKASNYKLQPPPSPFNRIDNEETDLAWQNPQTGNSIALLTECSEQKDPSLTSLEDETIQALTNPKVLKTEEIQFQERAARRTKAEGTVDGVPVQMDVLILKKNNCSYTFTFVGRASGIEKDRPAFDSFLSGVHIP